MTPFASAQELPPEARRYHEMLLRRPQAGTLFDRFHDTWLESAPADSLLSFLQQRSKQPEAKAADHRLLALLHARRGQDTEALKALEAALKLSPKDPDAWLEKARMQARVSDFEGALQSLKAAAEANPGEQLRIDIARQQGRALLRLNRTPEALQTWLDLAKQHPEDLDLTEDIVELMAEEGLYIEAATEAKKLVEKTRDPSEKLARQLRLGDLLLRAEKRDEALSVLEAALSQSGQDSWVEADVLSRLDEVFRREDDLEGLKKRLETLSTTQAQRVNLGIAYARVLGELGEADAAATLFLEWLARNPGRRDLQEAYIALLEDLDRIPEAATQAQILAKQHPEDKELLIRLASLQERQKDLPAAQATLASYLEKSAVNGLAPENDHLRVARLFENWGLKEAAKSAYEKLVSAHPQSVSAQEGLAHYLHRSGDDAAALLIWKGLVQKGDLEDILRAGQALLAHGQAKEAQALLVTREKDHATQPRYLGLLTQLALTNKESAKAVLWARARLALTGEASGLQEAVKLAHQAIRDAEAAPTIIAELQKQPSLTIPDRCLLAELLEEAGQSAAAETALQAPQATPAQQLMLGTQHVRLLEQRQEWKRAAEVLAQVMQLPGGMTSDRAQQLARLHRRTGAFDEALTALAEWKKISPGAVQPWLEESSILMEQGKQTAALDVLRAASRKFSEDKEILSTLASALASAGKMEEARIAYMALYEETEDPVARLRFLTPLAQMTQYAGTLPRLIEDFQQRQRQNRASPLPWLALATLHAATNNDEERRRCLYEASRLRPRDLALLSEIARIEEENGLYAEALKTLNAAASLDSTPTTRQKIASLMISNGDEEAGYRLMFELAGVATADARAIETMADTLCEHGQWERAIELLTPLLPRFPKDYRLHYLHAVALEEEGRQGEAIGAFVHLLSLHEELPEVLAAPPSATQQPQSYSAQLPNLPEGTAEWMQLPHVSHTAYQHRQKQRGSWGYGFMQVNRPTTPGLPSGWVQQPENVTNLSAMALYHLIQIGQGMKEEERSGLVKHLEVAGIREPALLLEVPMYEGQLSIPPDLLEAHPEHQALHALWLLHLNQFPGDFLPELKRCVALFKDSYPMLAFQAGVGALALNEPEADALASQVLSQSQNIPEGNGNTFNALLTAVQRRIIASNGGPPLSPELSQQVLTLAKTWSKTLYQGPDTNQQPWGAYALIMVFKALGNVEDVADLLEKENAQQLSRLSSTPRNQRYPTGYYEPQPLPALWTNLGLAPSMIELVQQLMQNNQFSYNGWMRNGPVDDETQVALTKIASHLKTPELQILMSCISGPATSAKEKLTQWLKQPGLTPDHWLFAASMAQILQDQALQITFLRELRTLGLDPALQSPVDNAVLFTALQQVNAGQPLTAEDKPFILESLERTRQAMSASQQNISLMDVAATLGFAEQAELIQKATAPRAQTARNNSSGNPFSRSHSRGQPSSLTKLEKFLTNKNSDATWTEFQQRVRRIGEIWLSADWSNADNELQSLRKMLDAQQATGPLMEKLKANPAKGWQQLQREAAFLELFGLEKEAVAAYEATLALKARNSEVQTRLAILLSRKDMDKALLHLSAIPRQDLNLALQRLSLEMNPRSQSGRVIEHRLAVIRLMAAYIEKNLDPKRRLEPSLLGVFAQMPNYAQQGEYGNVSFRGLHEVSRAAQNLSEAAQKAKDQLSAAHGELCLALMKIPMLAQCGFGPYAGLALKEGQPTEMLETLARDILNRQILARRYTPNIGYWFGRSPTRFGENGNQIAMPQPEDILLRGMVARGEKEKIESDFFSLVKRALGSTTEKQMRAYAQLLTCPEAEFLAVARDWQRSHADRGYSGTSQEITRIWGQRGFSTPIHEIYLERLKNPNYGIQTQELTTYIRMIAQTGKADEASRFIIQIRDLWLGKDREKRRQDLNQFVQQQLTNRRHFSPYNPSSTSTRWQNYFSLLSEVIRRGPQSIGIRAAQEDGLMDEPGLFSQVCGNLFDEEQIFGPTAELLVTLDALHFTGSARDFRLWFNQKGNQYTALQTLINRMDDSDPRIKKARDQLLEALKTRQPQTFGTDLLTSLTSSNSQNQGQVFKAFLMRRGKELPDLPAIAKLELSAFIAQQGSNFTRFFDDETRALLEPLNAAEREWALEKADLILAASTWEQTRMDDYNNDELLSKILQDVAFVNVEKARRLLKHCLVLLKQTPAQIQANANQDGPVSQLLARMGRVPQLMREVLAIAEAEKFNGEWTRQYLYALEGYDILNQPAHILALFTGTPFVEKAENFRGLVIPGGSEGLAMIRLLTQLRSRNNTKILTLLTTTLQERPSPTFGEKLARAALESSPTALENFIRANQADLRLLPTAEAVGLLNSLTSTNSKYAELHLMSEELQATLLPLFQARAAEDKKVLESFLDAPSLASSGQYLGNNQELAPKLRRYIRVSPKEARQVYEKLTLLIAAESRTQTGNSPSHTPLSNWLNQCAVIPELFQMAMERAESEGLLNEMDWLNNTLGSLHVEGQMDQSAKLLAFFNNSPFLNEAQTFRTYSLIGNSKSSFLAYLATIIKGKKNFPALILESLGERPETFGIKLLRCLLNEQPRKELAAFVKSHSDEITQMPAVSRADFDLLLESELSPLIVYAGDSPILHVLLQKQRERAEDTRMTLLTLSDNEGIQNRSQNNLLAQDLALIAQHNPNGVKNVVQHLVSLLSKTESNDANKNNPVRTKLGSFLQNLKLDPGLWPWMAQEAQKQGIDQHSEWLGVAYCGNYFQGRETDSAFILDAFARSGFFHEAADFNPLPGLGGTAYSSLLHFCIARLKLEDINADLQDYLAQQKSRTFGMDLLLALTESDRNQALNDFAKRRAKDFALLPAESKTLLMTALEVSWTSLRTSQEFPPEVREALQSVLEARQKKENSLLDSLLAAKDLGSLKMPEQLLYSNTKTLIRKLVAEKNQAQALQVFNKVSELLEASPMSRNMIPAPSDNTGRTLRSSFLLNCITPADYEMLAFGIQAFNADKSGQLAHSGWAVDYNWAFYLHQRWQAYGGRADPALALEKLMEELHSWLKDEPIPLMALAFHGLLTYASQADRQAFLQWSEKLPAAHPCKALARELEIAAKLYLEAYPEGISPQGTCAIRGHTAHEPLWSHYRKVIMNEKLNPQVRLALGHHLCVTYPWAIPGEVVMPLTRLLATENLQGHAVKSNTLAAVMRCFGRLPVTAEWRETAQMLWDGWVKKQNAKRDPSGRPVMFGVSFEARFAMLHLAGKMKNDAWIDVMLSKQASYMLQNRSIIAVLVDAGYPEKAAALLKEHHASMHAWQSGIYTWHPDMRKQLPAFLAACKDPQLALLGELIVLQASDPHPALLRAFKEPETLAKRIGKLAPKILKTRFTHDDIQMHAVSMVANYAPLAALDHLGDCCTEASNKISVQDLITLEDSGIRAMQEYILSTHFVRQALQGNLKPWIEAITTLTQGESADSYTSRSTLTDLINYPADAITALWERGEGRNAKLWLPFFEKYLLLGRAQQSYQMETAISFAYFLATQTEGGLEAWKKTLSPQQIKQYEDMLSKNDRILILADSYVGEKGSPARLKDEQRVKLMVSLFPSLRRTQNYPLLEKIQNKYQLLTHAEMMAQAQALHESGNPKWMRTYQLIESSWTAGAAAKAEPLFDLMLADKDLKPMDKNLILMRKAAFQIRLGKKAAAATTLTEIDTDKPAPLMPEEMQNLQRMLNALQ
ncbi:tetratricopeptide repeat protein [Prosthecobacter dejongeii]|uniref:tetratricopeptide repeat protein n=1 Tax=Prosthecobacter dejongeii TaxID=48465 RepID=UPI001608DCF0|nr:tetratricopeptide repeat protein [Prosthecobacter dejongeii]